MNPREDAEAIFRTAVARVAPARLIEEALSITNGGSILTVKTGVEEASYELSRFDRIFAAGMGKASAAMALPTNST